MSEHPDVIDESTPTDDPPQAGLLDTVAGRLIALVMGVLIVAGVIAIVVLLNNGDDASANQLPSERLLDRDFAVIGSEVLVIDPPVVSGTCPVDVHLTAEIRTTGAEGTLVYRWYFDDTGATEPQTLDFEEGQRSVMVELTQAMGGPDGKYEGLSEHVSIQILEQNGEETPIASRKSSFTIACGS